jgi:tetratricopeptide (TPR) repeat protein
MRRAAAFGLSLFCNEAAAFGQSAATRGLDHFYNLEYDQAIVDFQRNIAENPQVPSGYNYLAQGLLYREMFRAGALESELVSGANPFLRRKLEPSSDVETAFHRAIEDAMKKAQAVSDTNPGDIRATYSLGVAYGLRGNWNFLVRKAYLDALRDLTSSRKLCNRVLEMDPQFIDAKLIQGVHDYVVGSLPGYMRLLGFLGGIRGDRAAGIAALQDVAARGKINDNDAKLALCAIYRRERKPQEAIALLNDLIPRFPRNYLLWFEMAQMWADAGDGRKALAAVDKVEELNKSGVTGYGMLVPEKIAFARGNIQFWYNDLEKAETNLSSAVRNAGALDLHSGSTAWFRLGQTYDLRSRRPEAISAYRHVIALAPSSDVAKESKKYLGTPYRREKS